MKKRTLFAIILTLGIAAFLFLVIREINKISNETWKNILSALTILVGTGAESLLNVKISTNIDSHETINFKLIDIHRNGNVEKRNIKDVENYNEYNGVMPNKLTKSDYDHYNYIIKRMDKFKLNYNDSFSIMNESYSDDFVYENGNKIVGEYHDFDEVVFYIQNDSVIFSNDAIENSKKTLRSKLINFYKIRCKYFFCYSRIEPFEYWTLYHLIYSHPEVFYDYCHRKYNEEDEKRAEEENKIIDTAAKEMFDSYKDFLEVFNKNRD